MTLSFRIHPPLMFSWLQGINSHCCLSQTVLQFLTFATERVLTNTDDPFQLTEAWTELGGNGNCRTMPGHRSPSEHVVKHSRIVDLWKQPRSCVRPCPFFFNINLLILCVSQLCRILIACVLEIKSSNLDPSSILSHKIIELLAPSFLIC